MTARIAIIGTGFRPSGTSEPPIEIKDIISNNFSATLFETRSYEFPSTPEKRALVEKAYIETGSRAAAEGYDAIFINTVGDYGLDGLREELDIPIIGAGETAAKTASHISEQFSIVTIWPTSMDFIYQDLLQSTNTREKCQQIVNLSDDDDLKTLGNEENFVTDLRSCSISAFSQLKTATTELIDQSNDCIVIGCTCMAPAAKNLKTTTSIPLLDPMTLGYQFTEYWLSSNDMKSPPFEAFANSIVQK